VVRLLLEAGADVTLEGRGASAKGTALDMARGTGNDEIVQLLIEHDAAE
jgi:ankyrin repeat protein